MYRQGTALARVSWNPYLYDPLLRRRLGPHHRADAALLGRPRPAGAARPCGEAWRRGDPGRRAARVRRFRPRAAPRGAGRGGGGRRRVLRAAGRRRGEVLLLPPDAVRDGARRAVVVGDAVQPSLRPGRWATRSITSTSTSSSTPSALGWDGICVNEHHQNCYGTMPSPNVMAAMLVRRTTRAKIAILGNGLPLRENPLRIAEEIAMLDVASGGRIDLRVRARDRRGVLLDRREPDALARAFLRGGRPHPAAPGPSRGRSPSTAGSTATRT